MVAVTVDSVPTNYEAMVAQGCTEAAKATTIAGEYAAWDAVVAQHMPIEERRTWRPGWMINSRAGRGQDPATRGGELCPTQRTETSGLGDPSGGHMRRGPGDVRRNDPST